MRFDEIDQRLWALDDDFGDERHLYSQRVILRWRYSVLLLMDKLFRMSTVISTPLFSIRKRDYTKREANQIIVVIQNIQRGAGMAK
ncbi:hypothetical protein KCP75_01710 [Salmonella enterica subsp. enterica]|nr:hypothetical protein KCP75_01710 [Salmonella enterica subsp. enterica]